MGMRMPRKKQPGKVEQAHVSPGRDVSLGGVPVKADEEKLKIIVNALRMGSHFEIAACVAGLSAKSVRNYMLRAREEPDSIYGLFLREITRAMSEGELRDLSVIDSAAQGRPAKYLMIPKVDMNGKVVLDQYGNTVMEAQLDGDGKPICIQRESFPQWQASAWKLERSKPKRWGRYDRVMIDDVQDFQDDGRVKTEEEKIDAGETAARAKRLQRVMTVLNAVPEDTDLGDV